MPSATTLLGSARQRKYSQHPVVLRATLGSLLGVRPGWGSNPGLLHAKHTLGYLSALTFLQVAKRHGQLIPELSLELSQHGRWHDCWVLCLSELMWNEDPDGSL